MKNSSIIGSDYRGSHEWDPSPPNHFPGQVAFNHCQTLYAELAEIQSSLNDKLSLTARDITSGSNDRKYSSKSAYHQTLSLSGSIIISPMIKCQNNEVEEKSLPIFTGTMSIILGPGVA